MLWICTGCRAAYSPYAPRCPQCGCAEHVDQGEERLLDTALPLATVTVDGVDAGPGEIVELPAGRPHKPLPEVSDNGEQAEHLGEPDYDQWNLQELRTEAKRRNLPAAGDRPALAARLREHDDQALAES